MNYFDYVEATKEEVKQAVEDGWLIHNQHKTLPLDIYSYGRKAVQQHMWSKITLRSRGIVVHRETGEIIARPFEKFFNYSLADDALQFHIQKAATTTPGYVWQKMDGFMLTRVVFDGKQFMTSKTSFDSFHAKWGTAELNKEKRMFPEGYTAVFEGIHPDMRIVVNYGDRSELVLLALINTETGEEMSPGELRYWAVKSGLSVPYFTPLIDVDIDVLYSRTLNDEVKNDEGYVITWYPSGSVPVRAKMKYQEYLRLHRLVTQVSPKAILEMLQSGWTSEIDELLNNSTKWMAEWTRKWKTILEQTYEEINEKVITYYAIAQTAVGDPNKYENLGALRKAWALQFTSDRMKWVSAILFAKLDGRDINPYIWKLAGRKTMGRGPLRSDFE